MERRIDQANFYNATKVLPVAYDDSLSYYEMLCKFQNSLNEVIDAINSDFREVVEKNVEKYFNSIMIDAMYTEEDETITLKKEIVSTSDVHSYSLGTTTMSIG